VILAALLGALVGCSGGGQGARTTGTGGNGGGGQTGGAGGGGGGGAGPMAMTAACTFRPETPLALCADPSSCPVEASVSIDCGARARRPSVVVRGGAVYAALTPFSAPGGARGPLQIARLEGLVDLSARELDAAGDGFLLRDATATGPARAMADTPDGADLFSEQPDRTWAASGALARPPTSNGGFLFSAAGDAAGVVHALWTGGSRTTSAGLSWSASDGSRAVVTQAAVVAAALLTDPPRVFYFDDTGGLQSWNAGGTSANVFQLGGTLPPTLGRMTASADGGVLSIDFRSARSDGSILTTVNIEHTAGPGLRNVWDGEVPAQACDGQMTVPAPNICSTDTTTVTGTALPPGAHVALSGPVGARLVVVASGDVTETCGWTPISGCFETSPCDCRQHAGASYRLKLRVFRESSLPAAILELALPGTMSDVQLAADADDARLAVLLIDPTATTNAARLIVMDRAAL